MPFIPRFIVLFLIMLIATPAMAQNNATSPSSRNAPPLLPGLIRLSTLNDIYTIGSRTFITRDATGRQTYTQVIDNHLSGARRGVVSNKGIISLGSTPVPFWMVFAVKNDTLTTNRYVMTLGDHSDGAMGAFSRVFVYEHFSKRYLLSLMPDANGKVPEADKIRYKTNGMSLTLTPGQQALITIYGIPEGGSPTTITPTIMTEDAFWNAQTQIKSLPNLIPLLLLGCVGYFVGLLVIRRKFYALSFILYTASQIAFFRVNNMDPQSTFPLASETPLILLTLTGVAGLFLNRMFLSVPRKVRQENLVLAIAILATGATLATSLLMFPGSGTLRGIALIALPMFLYMFLSVLALAQSLSGRPVGNMLALGWLVLLAGALISILSMAGIIASTPFLASAYWMALGVQMSILIFATVYESWVMEKSVQIEEQETQEEEQNVLRMRQARDSAENARLLKVIEHERQMLQELRDRELQQNEEMRQAKNDADRANRAKSAFLAVISHEIRTPMSGIMGMVRLLLETPLTRDQTDYARTIQASGDAMLALLNDILDFEKIETGKMELEIVDFDLRRLINDIITLMSGHASQKSLILRADIAADVPRYVRGDPVRLRQVLLNLTGNAIKFTSAGSVVLTINSTEAPGNAHNIYFGVKDSGIGISKEAQKNLFNPFSQADTSISRKYGGSGLGLAICQRLIEAMGSKISIDSIEGEGSTFFFTIALEGGAADQVTDLSSGSSQRVGGQKPERSLQILCIDDNEINQKLLKEFVTRMGHTATLAGTGEAAIELVRQQDFDMVLMDIELPGISGMGATRAIRGLPDRAKAAIPVIALTGNVRDEDIRLCYSANMNGHLAKPIEPDKLRQQIEKVTQGKLDNPVELENVEQNAPVINEIRIDPDAGLKKPANPNTLPVDAMDLESAANTGFIAEPEYEIAPIRAIASKVPQPVEGFIDTPFDPSTMSEDDLDLDNDSFADAISFSRENGEDAVTHPYPESEPPFDPSILGGLKGTMNREDLHDMIEGLLMKNEEIIAAMAVAVLERNYTVLRARAHELKGMCGNFGLRQLSIAGAYIEKAARDETLDGLSAIISDLPQAQLVARAAIEQWIES